MTASATTTVEADPETLWAVHIEGPDSVIARPSKDDARRDAAELNAQYVKYKQRPDASEDDARWHATVVPWHGSAKEHAEALATDDGDWF